MKPHEIITVEPGQKSRSAPVKSFSPTRILVPVDSSGNAFNSLAYTLRLAKAWNAGMHLFYIIDVDEIPDSASAFVIQGVLNRLESRASACLESLKELIQSSGVEVVSAEFELGRVGPLLRKKIESVKPGLIVSGRDSVDKSVMKRLVRQAACPVLIVPETAAPKVPTSVLILNDREELLDPQLDSIATILKTSHHLHIITTAKIELQDHRKTGREDLTITVHPCEDAEPVKAAEQFVADHTIDMACTVLQEQSFIERLFGRCIPLELARKLSIPVLVMQS